MKTIKVRIRGDLVRFLSWLENFVMLNVVKTSYYNNPKFGDTNDGDYIVAPMRLEPSGGVVPVQYLKNRVFKPAEILVRVSSIPEGCEVSFSYPEEITHFATELSLQAQSKFGTVDTPSGNPSLPVIEDPTDQRIWEIVIKDPRITDDEIAAKLGVTRAAVNHRRNALRKMGYKVR